MSKINLSESVVAALELTKQALEVFYGFEITFSSEMLIEPRKIIKHRMGDRVIDARCVMINGRFRQRDGDDSIRLFSEVHLKNVRVGWEAVVVRLCLGEPEGTHSWCAARWDLDKDRHTVRVIVEMGEGSDDHNWRVGHGIADRHLEPLYPVTQQ